MELVEGVQDVEGVEEVLVWCDITEDVFLFVNCVLCFCTTYQPFRHVA